LAEDLTLQGAGVCTALFCSATLAWFYSALDTRF
jgi:hypothetical protein